MECGYIFLVPAIFFHLIGVFGHIGPHFKVGIKILAVILALFGGPFLILGLCYLFWQPQRQKEETSKISQQEIVEQKATRRKADLALIITLLNFATALIMLISAFSRH